MRELSQQEHLQPSLLDRLTDDSPTRQTESRDRRVLSVEKLRECVLRDLSWLLNTGHLAASVDLDEFPDVARSVLNYGVPDLTGKTASSADLGELETVLCQAIWDFEPRLIRDSVRVRALPAAGQMTHNALAFEIEGELWADPVPLQLLLRTEFDLESGSVSVAETTGPGRS